MSKEKTQKIIIPKGTIDPNEDTLIEIPTELQQQPIVVAKKDLYQEKSVSIETTSRNTVYEGNKYSFLGGPSRVNVARRPVKSSSNVIGRKLDELLRAGQELQETALLAATAPPPLANVSCQTTCPSSVTSELSTKRNRSTLSNTVPEENAGRHSRTQSVGSVAASPKAAEPGEDFPPLTSTMRSDVQVSPRSLHGGVDTTFEEKRISFRVDKDTSDINPLPRQEKGVQSACRQRGSEELILPRRKRPKDDCTKSKKAAQKKESATSWREDGRGSQDRLKTCDKCSSDQIDDIYIGQLKRQFEEAKRKLDDAVTLASVSLKKLSDKRYLGTSAKGADAFGKTSSVICDSVPERDVSFVPWCSRQSLAVSCRILNQEQAINKAPSYDFSLSDTSDRNDIYKNIVTRRATEEPRKRSVQSEWDSPCSFLKPPKPDNSINKPQRENDVIPCPSLKLNNAPLKPSVPPDAKKKPEVVLKEKVVQTDKTALPTRLSRCSCSKMKDSGSIKFMKEPRSNFSNSSNSGSVVNQGSSLI